MRAILTGCLDDIMSTLSQKEQDLERQLRQACEALEQRVRAGQDYHTEECLAANPELATDVDAILELAYFEYVLREELGQAPSAEDWYHRFPEQQSALEKILKIHHGSSNHSSSVRLSAHLDTMVPSQTMVQKKQPVQTGLGKYELLGELGRGAMGVVYKARERALDRIVAIKVILAGPHAGQDRLDQAYREARAIARLQHPNIVQIHEIGEEDGRPFLCMEYVDGPGLDRLLRRWQGQGSPGLAPDVAANLLQTVARAVHYAHQQGIVHRDLKPANILMRGAVGESPHTSARETESAGLDLQSVVPKIADFGLAKFLDSPAGATCTGQLVGTPSFMAPEQADGRVDEVGPAADVYALGVILYELLAGRPPFQATTVQLSLELTRTAEPLPPRRWRPNLPRDLQTICLKCLAKEPGGRYASALALAEDLRRYLAGEPIRAVAATRYERLAKWVKRRPVVAGLLAALMIVLAGGVTGIIWQWQRAEQNAATALENARDFKLERDKAIEERGRAERHLKSARESIDELAKLGDRLWAQARTNRTGKVLLEKVLAFYQEVLKDESTDPAVRLSTAQVCGQVSQIRHTLGQLDRAVEACEQESSLLAGLVKENPDNAYYELRLGESLRNRAHILRDLGKSQQALALYRDAAKLGEQLLVRTPTDPGYQDYLANTLLNTVTVLPQNEHVQEIEAMYRRAVELVQSALQTHPDDVGYRNELALCLEGQGIFNLERNQPALAEENLRSSIEIRESLHKAGKLDRWAERYLGRAYSGLGLVVARRGRSSEAMEIYAKAEAIQNRLTKENPAGVFFRGDLSRTLTRRGRLQWSLANYSGAAQSYRQAVQVDPESADANNLLAWFLATCPEPGFRDSREAVRQAKIALAAKPTSGEILNTLGVTYYRDGDCQSAIDMLNQSMALRSGGDASDWFFLAMAHWKSGNREEARRWLARGVEWIEKNPVHDEELTRFQTEALSLLKDSSIPVLAPVTRTPSSFTSNR